MVIITLRFEPQFKCKNCGKEYQYVKEKCKCGGIDFEVIKIHGNNDNNDNDNDNGNDNGNDSNNITEKVEKDAEKIEIPSGDKPVKKSIDDINKETVKRKNARKLNPKKKEKRKATAQDLEGFALMCTKVTNNMIKKIPKDWKYYPVFDIWIFEDDEIIDFVDSVYMVIDKYYPEWLYKIGDSGFFAIFGLIGALFELIFSRVIDSVKVAIKIKKGEYDKDDIPEVEEFEVIMDE